ncbi:MAG: hypothetical protein R2713_06980 [Ilumatobacteraceae bacterium]
MVVDDVGQTGDVEQARLGVGIEGVPGDLGTHHGQPGRQPGAFEARVPGDEDPAAGEP